MVLRNTGVCCGGGPCADTAMTARSTTTIATLVFISSSPWQGKVHYAAATANSSGDLSNTLGGEHLHQAVALVALKDDASIFDRAAAPEPGLEEFPPAFEIG